MVGKHTEREREREERGTKCERERETERDRERQRETKRDIERQGETVRDRERQGEIGRERERDRERQRETERQRHRERQRETETQRHRERERQRDRERERERVRETETDRESVCRSVCELIVFQLCPFQCWCLYCVWWYTCCVILACLCCFGWRLCGALKWSAWGACVDCVVCAQSIEPRRLCLLLPCAQRETERVTSECVPSGLCVCRLPSNPVCLSCARDPFLNQLLCYVVTGAWNMFCLVVCP
jgi:hypothetical protein